MRRTAIALGRASFAYHAAMRDALPPKPLPKPHTDVK